jgi:uncharacterized protein YeaO (DUF488 family)
MVKTKSVYDLFEKSDGERILVTRYWPRGLSKERLRLTEYRKELAPSVRLLKDWKSQQISWDEYQMRYHKEMLERHEAVKQLAERAKHGTITLLCFEREDNPCCHRHLLKRLIEKEDRNVE